MWMATPPGAAELFSGALVTCAGAPSLAGRTSSKTGETADRPCNSTSHFIEAVSGLVCMLAIAVINAQSPVTGVNAWRPALRNRASIAGFAAAIPTAQGPQRMEDAESPAQQVVQSGALLHILSRVPHTCHLLQITMIF